MPDLSILFTRRIALLGIGSDFNGDDAAGLMVARELKRQLIPLPPDLLILETGPAPENFTSTVRRFHPNLTLFVDAAQMGLEAGSLCLLDWRDTLGWSGSTHSLPLSLLAKFITQELNCPVYLLGIQPAETCQGDSVSHAVAEAVQIAANHLAVHLTRPQHN